MIERLGSVPRHRRTRQRVADTLVLLDHIVKGCEETLAAGPDTDLSRALAKAQAAQAEYAGALQRKEAAAVEMRLASGAFDRAVIDTDDRLEELRAAIGAKYGFRSPKLAAFGIRPRPPRGRPRRSKPTPESPA